MIIWINGAFGAGKTETAHELHRRLSSSFVFDPENVGFYIRENVPKAASREDFQDYPMWREFTCSMLRHIEREYEGMIIVPMTVVNPQYFSEIVERLHDDGISVHHYALCASPERLLERLKKRGEGQTSWAAQQIDRCMAGLSHEAFAHHLDTNDLSIAEVVEIIASMSHVRLDPCR